MRIRGTMRSACDAARAVLVAVAGLVAAGCPAVRRRTAGRSRKGYLEIDPPAHHAHLDRDGQRRPQPLCDRRGARLRRAKSRRTTCWSTISTTCRTCRAPATTIVDYNPATKKTTAVREPAAAPAAMSRRRRPDNRHDHAQERLGDRRQHAQHRRHHPHQGRRLPAGARFQRAARRHLDRPEHQRPLGQHGDDRQRRHRDAVRQHGRVRRARSGGARSRRPATR